MEILIYNQVMNIQKLKNEIIVSSHSISGKGEKDFRIHCHDSYEVLYFVSGDIHYYIEGETYFPAKGSLLLMPPGVIHGIEANLTDGYERYVAHIKKEAAAQSTVLLIEKVFSKGRYYVLNEGSGIKEAFDDMYQASETSDTLFTPSLDALLLKILLFQNKAQDVKPEGTTSKIITKVINYLNENFYKEQTLDEIASQFFLSKHHLNELFRKATGVTVWEYIIRKRIYLAKTLMQKGVSATEAAYQAGFSDYSVFYKAYKKRNGKSPKTK
ncbi:MAG: helix-turn-helix transcriptional regulator [Clostridia bacterium]|nr:helix-turn-helix transcriptional regulator [Clostridia bacterium]